jgi:hypothetical protein
MRCAFSVKYADKAHRGAPFVGYIDIRRTATAPGKALAKSPRF